AGSASQRVVRPRFMMGSIMQTAQPRTPRRRAMVAMVLGTALAALGPSARAGDDVSPRAINDISRYCTACWRNARLPADRWGDCTQEVFSRLLDRVPTEDWDRLLNGEGEERREFLRAIDAVKKRTQRDSRRNVNLVSIVPDSRDNDLHQRAVEREAGAQP